MFLKELDVDGIYYGDEGVLYEAMELGLSLIHIWYYLLKGDTTKIKRREMVNAFRNDDTPIFLISLKAGGTGLNLTAAEAVIHFDPWWNVSAQNQATDRTHRIGQKKHVQVYQLIMKDSIEEKIQNLQAAKQKLADTFIGEDQCGVASMKFEELVSLFELEESIE